MKKHPPKKINALFGYRTELSMKNADTWSFAHKHCGALWLKAGLIMLIPSIIPFIPIYKASEGIITAAGLIIMSVQLIILIICIFPTEKALKENFNSDGTPK